MKQTFYLIMLSLFTLGNFHAQNSFEFVVLPDTQTYVEQFPEVYMKQMEWIEAHSDRFAFVLHVGDITQNNSDAEWALARKGFALLDGKVPYNLALGNHDIGSAPGKVADTRDATLANRYFPFDTYKEHSNTLGSFPTETVDNTYAEYVLNGQKWLVVSLEFGPRNKTVTWANEIIQHYPEHHVIINTHAYLYDDNTWHTGDHKYLPQKYGIGKAEGDEAVNDGSQLWEKLVKPNKNVFMVISGHITGKGTGQLVSKNDGGRKVYQMLSNYQKNVKGVEKGDSGYLRIIKVNPDQQTISVTTYSPWLDTFNTDADQEFEFKDVEFLNFAND